jgi:hypothetical protein
MNDLRMRELSSVQPRLIGWPPHSVALLPIIYSVFFLQPLIVNMVSISSDHEYIVAVTDCNLVCVWKRVS